MAGGKRGRTDPGTEPDLPSAGPPDTTVAPVSAAAVATATAAAVLGCAAALISVMTLFSDGAKLHAVIALLLFVPSAVIGLLSTFVQRRFVAEHLGRLHTEIARRDDARRRLAEEVDRRGADIAELHRSRQLLLAEDDLLRERMQESFVNLSMRTLTLVERQLDLIERLEHTEEDARRLEDLFRLDHLATRMRRNSENVLVLANADERHGHRPPGTLLDVVRAAVSEIEYYERVDIGHIPRVELAGHTADDISHLLAELLENAAAYSPPSTRVTVAGRTLENRGVLVTVEDEGFGVPADRLPELNAQLLGGRVATGAPDLAGLGVFVVGALAARHGLRVQLRPRREGGLAAIVMLPAALLHGPGPTPADITHERELDRAHMAARDGANAGRPTGGTGRSSLRARHENAPSGVGAPTPGGIPSGAESPSAHGAAADDTVVPVAPAEAAGPRDDRQISSGSPGVWNGAPDPGARSAADDSASSSAGRSGGGAPGAELPALPRRVSRPATRPDAAGAAASGTGTSPPPLPRRTGSAGSGANVPRTSPPEAGAGLPPLPKRPGGTGASRTPAHAGPPDPGETPVAHDAFDRSAWPDPGVPADRFAAEPPAAATAFAGPPVPADAASEPTAFAQDPEATALLRIAERLTADMPADPSGGIRVADDAAVAPLPRRSRTGRGSEGKTRGSRPSPEPAATRAAGRPAEPSPGGEPVTRAGLPKRVARERTDDAATGGFPGPAAGLLSGSPAEERAGGRGGGPVDADELRRRLSGFQRGCTAARQVPDEDDPLGSTNRSGAPVSSVPSEPSGLPDDTARARGGELP
ncbi:ATP-binding protein [Yinghuangia sp. ASG 101]|uniref:sensor histidine kinase n=1 Tax=Yinghuangia sp. ASG 101 TaxID=2896848 RepID=UPI001E491DF5|nr:ATP-binding protein [Yinghuangia sp. ASG 101]UGQ14229.1 ATP-binding protein [Yinghuangia sp. ASG 101]